MHRHIVVAACLWLGCGASTQSEVRRNSGEEHGADPRAPRCALGGDPDRREVTCCLVGGEHLDALVFVGPPGGRFAGARLAKAAGECLYRAHLASAPAAAAEYYVALFDAAELVEESAPRLLPSGEVAPASRRRSDPGVVVDQEEEDADHDDGQARPPITPGRLVGEVFLGGLLALPSLFVGGVVGAAIGTPIEDCEGEEYCGLASVVIGAYLGGTIGYSAGVYLAGEVGDQTGSFGATLLGGLGGAALGLAVVVGSDGEDGGGVLLVLPVVTAVVGFNLSRRYEKGHRPKFGALVQVDEHGVALGVPIAVGDAASRALVVPLTGGRF